MKTPVYDLVRGYVRSGFSRLHMPGHKGRKRLGPERYDLTEITGLIESYGESESIATRIFGTEGTFYSQEGSTLCIKAMLAIIRRQKNGRIKVIAGRNAHRAFIYAAALLDIEVEWMYPDKASHLCKCELTADCLRRYIEKSDSKPDAVYITSPDYLGNIADIRAIAKVCHTEGIPLLVDNAHGAYLKFLEKSQHPIDLGADMCCDSAHKTLPVLTGGAYLHIARGGREYLRYVRDALALFASTSPSHLIGQSLDLCNSYLMNGYQGKLAKCIATVNKAKQIIRESGCLCEDTEPLKITLDLSELRYTGAAFKALLAKFRIEAEFIDDEFAVFMASPDNKPRDYRRLTKAVLYAKANPLPDFVSQDRALCPQPLATAMSVREATLAPRESVSVDNSVGRILASPTVSFPPCIPIAVCGEVLDGNAVALFHRYGIKEVDVVIY